MKSKKLLSLTSLLAAAFIYLTMSSYSGGITGQSTTGCAGGMCHGTSGTGTTISLTGIPAGGYVLGNVYPLTLTVSNLTKAAAGFNLTASAGIFNSPPTGIAQNGLLELYHNTPKSAISGITTWNFSWIAPSTGSSVTFNIAGNAVDNSGNASGDDYATKVVTVNATVAAPSAPSITAPAVSGITTSGATLTANVNANNASTMVYVQYGLSNSYGTTLATSPATVSGSTPMPVTKALTGLTPGTTYHFRFKAVNSVDSSFSNDQIFKTLFPASVTDIETLPFSIYPNPTNHQLTFTSNVLKQNLNFSVLSIDGKQIEILANKTTNGYQLHVDELSTGNYFLQISTEEKKYSYFFTKQ